MEHAGREINYQPEVQVEGSTYKVHLLAPEASFLMSARLTRLVGEPLSMLAAAADDDEDATQKKIVEILPMAVRSLVKNVDEAQALQLIKDLINTVSFENKPINFQRHFHGRMGHLYALVGEVVKVQFKDFFFALSQSIADVRAGA